MKFSKEKNIWEALSSYKRKSTTPKKKTPVKVPKQKVLVPVPVPPTSKTTHEQLSVLFRTTKSSQSEIFLKKLSVSPILNKFYHLPYI